MKTSKCLKCEFKSSFNGKYGTLHSFDVEFENGDKGLYISSNKNAPKFKVGEEASYDIVAKEGKNGVWNKINPIKPSFNNSKHDPKRQQQIIKMTIVSCIIRTKELLPDIDEKECLKKYNEFIMSLGDTNNSNDVQSFIAGQSSLKTAIEAINIPAWQIRSIEDIIEKAKEYYKYIIS